MVKLSQLRLIDDANDGVWVEYEMGIELKIARMPNPKFTAFLRKLQKPHLRQIRSGTFDPEQEEDFVKRAIAKHVLVDVRGLENDDGEPVVYSSEWALSCFNDTNLADLYEFVKLQSVHRGNYLQGLQDNDAEN